MPTEAGRFEESPRSGSRRCAPRALYGSPFYPGARCSSCGATSRPTRRDPSRTRTHATSRSGPRYFSIGRKAVCPQKPPLPGTSNGAVLDLGTAGTFLLCRSGAPAVRECADPESRNWQVVRSPRALVVYRPGYGARFERGLPARSRTGQTNPRRAPAGHARNATPASRPGAGGGSLRTETAPWGHDPRDLHATSRCSRWSRRKRRSLDPHRRDDDVRLPPRLRS